VNILVASKERLDLFVSSY